MNKYDNRDKHLNELKERLIEYRQEPEDKVWNSIEKGLSRKAFPFKTLSIIGIVGIVVATAFVVFAPNSRQIKESISLNKHTGNKQQNITKKKDIRSGRNQLSTTIFSKIESLISKDSQEDTDIQDNTPVNDEKTAAISKNTNTLHENSPASENNMDNNNGTIVEDKTAINNNRTEDIANREEKKSIQTKTDPTEEEIPVSEKLYVPNAFTPSKTTNNIFKPAYRDLQSYEMKIYSRNGSLLFTSNDISIGWDGKIKGTTGKAGVYVYIINFTNKEGKKRTQKGNLMLLN